MSKELVEFARSVNRLLPNIWREFTRRQMRRPAWGRISVPQIMILEFLYRRGRCIMRELAVALSISTPAVTGLVDRMVRSRFLRRARGEKDRRVINIELTQRGRKVASSILSSRERMVQDIFGELKPSERNTYLRILEKVSDVIKRRSKDMEK